MSQIKYHNAKDLEGHIVSIHDVTEHGAFFCIGCGREMVAKLGSKKEHHFAHKQVGECNPETYLHNYAKRLVKQNFDKPGPFYMRFKQEIKCALFDDCRYRGSADFNCKCSRQENVAYDLKRYYNTAEVESEYKGFKADIKLSHSEHPNRKPVFIEVAVTHSCTQEKKDSGIKIIEINLPKDTDNFSFLAELVECDNNKKVGISFFNFERNKNQIGSKIFNKYGFYVYFLDTPKYLNRIRINDNCSCFGKEKYTEPNRLEIQIPTDVKQKVYYSLFKAIFPELESCYFCGNENGCSERMRVMNPNFACGCSKYQFDETKILNRNYKYEIHDGNVANVFVMKKND